MAGDLEPARWPVNALRRPNIAAGDGHRPAGRLSSPHQDGGWPMMRMLGRAAVLLAALGGLAAPPAGAETARAWPGQPAQFSAPAPAPTPPPAPAPDCGGRDLMADLPAGARAELERAVAATPYARGIRWTARRGAARIEIVGTYHFDDPRLGPLARSLEPVLAGAGALLVEAGPEEEKTLREAMARDPALVLDQDGPGLPERLGPADWAALSATMAERGVSPAMAGRMRPWFATTILGLSPCMLAQARGGREPGLDHRLIDLARTQGVPVIALEPWDTVLTLFDALDEGDALDMIRAALPAARLADDYARTTIEAYVRGDIRAIWEFERLDAYGASGLDRAAVDRQQAIAEERLMTRRNAGWIAPLTAAAERAAAQGKPVLAAFGALHLPGEDGVLRRLEREGWTIEAGAVALDAVR